MENNETDFIDVDSLQYRIAGFPEDVSMFADGLPYIATINEQAIQSDIEAQQEDVVQMYCDLFVSNRTGASHASILKQYGIEVQKPVILSGGVVQFIDDDGLVIVRDDAHPFGEDPPPVRQKIARVIGRKIKNLLRLPLVTFKVVSHADRVSFLWKGLKNKISLALEKHRERKRRRRGE